MNDKYIAHATVYDDHRAYSETIDYSEYFGYFDDDDRSYPNVQPLDCLEKDVPSGHWAYGWLETLAQSDETSSLMGFWEPIGPMRVKATMELPDYNPNYGNDRVCICGHKYRDHFKGAEELHQVGCAECGYHAFKEK